MTSNQTNQLYTLRFFQVCVAVVLFMTGLALQFHFGQYVEFLGHGVDTLGRILSISMIGTLAIRLHIGRWIDRFGCRPTWICGALIVALCVGSLQFVERLWLLTLLRAVSTMASAAVMTTVAVFAALTAPPHRRAESIGTIGMAGFVGMIAGPTLGEITAERLILRLRTRSSGDFIVLLTVDSANSETIYLPHAQISSTMGMELKQQLARLGG